MRLVLIEDQQALREGLELLLAREGCEVVGTAGTADEVTDWWRSSRQTSRSSTSGSATTTAST